MVEVEVEEEVVVVVVVVMLASVLPTPVNHGSFDGKATRQQQTVQAPMNTQTQSNTDATQTSSSASD